jgi:hypothetical protein
MNNEPYRDLGHHETADILATMLRQAGNSVHREFWLPDGRVADLFWLTPDQHFQIAEVKLELKASLLDQAMSKYARWCHSLWFVVPDLVPSPAQQFANWHGWRNPRDSLGIMGVHRDAAAIYRQPELRSMPNHIYVRLRALHLHA